MEKTGEEPERERNGAGSGVEVKRKKKQNRGCLCLCKCVMSVLVDHGMLFVTRVKSRQKRAVHRARPYVRLFTW